MNNQRESLPTHLSQRLAALSPEQRALLQKRIQQKADDAHGSHKILRQQNRHCFPLSFAQERLWFLSQMEPDNPAYNVPQVMQFKGPLDIFALERTFNELLQRHDVLRTTFLFDDEEPVQIVAPELTILLPVIDLQQLPNERREDVARQLIMEAVQQPFDLEEGPLLRLLVLRFSQEYHVLLLNMHHILCDGWSMRRILSNEIKTLYASFTRGLSSPLPTLPIQYGDYAFWQRHYLQGKTMDDLLNYWATRLQDVPALNLPYDHPRVARGQPGSEKVHFKFSHPLLASLRSLCHEEGVTLFMALLAGFQSLLYRHTHQEKITLGVSVNDRDQPETNLLIGFFVNMLLLQTDFAESPTFREVLQRVRTVCLDGYSHRDLPFEKLVQILHPGRLGNRTPLVQVTFDFQKKAQRTEDNVGVRIEPFPGIAVGRARFDLTMRLSESAEYVEGSLEYNTNLFERATIAKIADQFTTLLDGFVRYPHVPIGEVLLEHDAINN
jgi:hypothetical protein